MTTVMRSSGSDNCTLVMTSMHMHHYDGNCHCGHYRFTVSLPEEIRSAISCTCSLCTKKGLPVVGSTRGELSLWQYEVKETVDMCVVGEHSAGALKGTFLVNVRAIQGVNPFDIEAAITTANTEDGQQTTGSIDTGPPNTFSCHCGNVKATLNVPLHDQEAKEDNCSRCVRTGYIGVYPTKGEVSIPASSSENSFAYGGRYGGGSSHCKTCGVFVFDEVVGPPISVFDNVSPERREHLLGVYHKNMSLQPLNVRCVEGVDLGSLDIQRLDEGTEGYTLDQ
ncbi:glutathione-dependent formaldehyde-activating enzyme [Apiospora rasikravindrae]|uniref:Glutathione-dependent formaldehyde-activating enzyme n=1 Tax=Apiospora rasikravindrae TaxID=990691 RepID=A0ABR1U0S0_9PEZI